MHDEAEHDLSLPQLLYALILALVPFVQSILANPDCASSPAGRRLARTLRCIQAIAALFGARPSASAIPAPAIAPPGIAGSHRRHRATLNHIPTMPRPAPWFPIPGPTLEPARTLEL